MITNYHLYDGKGNLIDIVQIEAPDPVPVPTDLEIRLAALEAKTGITEADKLAAKAALENG